MTNANVMEVGSGKCKGKRGRAVYGKAFFGGARLKKTILSRGCFHQEGQYYYY